VDALFALPLDEFVAGRNALAKQLRADGDREGARRVAALRKPAAAAWVVNQLARTAPAETAALLEAGQRVAEAQAGALRGAGSAPLRDAAADEREALRHLLDRARPLVRNDQQLHRVADTLRAAATDPAVAELVTGGRLTAEPQPSGFGGLDGPDATPAGEGATGPGVEHRLEEAARRAWRRRVADLARQAEDAERDAERLERRASSAEAEARARRDDADLARDEARARRAAADEAAAGP